VAIWALTNCLRLFDIENQTNSVSSGIPLPSLSTVTQAGTCCDGSQCRTTGGNLLLSPGICSLLCNSLVPGSLCRTCQACCMPLPFTLGAEGLNHAARPAFLCCGHRSPHWRFPIPVQWGWVVDAAWWEAQQMQDISLSSSPNVRVAALFWVVVLAAGQSGLKHSCF